MRRADLFRLLGGVGKFAVVMLGAVVEAEHGTDFMVRPRPVERGHRIHATGAEHNNFHACI